MPRMRLTLTVLIVLMAITATVTALLTAAVSGGLPLRLAGVDAARVSSQPAAQEAGVLPATGEDALLASAPRAITGQAVPEGENTGESADEPVNPPGRLRGAASDGMLAVNETVTVMAGVEVTIDGQTYRLNVPAQLSIDTITALSDAAFISDPGKRVGILQWEVTEIHEYSEEYAVSQFTNITPSSPGNKLVVVYSLATNLGREPFNFTRGLRDEFAYDALGNRYSATRRSCDDINPGATLTCRIIFDVPREVEIAGLELGVVDYKRMPFPVSAQSTE